jgi:hypothetical protein
MNRYLASLLIVVGFSSPALAEVELKLSTASQVVPLGFFVDSTDGNTEETGLTIANTSIKLWKAGATTLVSKNSGGATHISNGVYYCTLDETDTDTVGPLFIYIHVAGARPVVVECQVMPTQVYDTLITFTSFFNDEVTVILDESTLGAIASLGSTVSPKFVDESHTWRFEAADQMTSGNSINETVGFDALVSMRFVRAVPVGASLYSVVSTSITKSDGSAVTTEVLLGTAQLTPDKTGVHVPLEAVTAGEYIVTVKISTTDSQIISRKGNLIIQ